MWIRNIWQTWQSDVLEFLWTSSVLGGTDIISCFMGQNVTIPVYKGEIQARNLGMAVEAWNDEGTYHQNIIALTKQSSYDAKCVSHQMANSQL